MTNYFTHCRTCEEIKAEYRRQAVRLHPDNGGDVKAFQEMQAEFTARFDKVKNIHTNKEGETYEKKGENASTETAADFMNIINVVLTLDGVEIELCGRWLWLSGNTKPHKDVIKELGFKWSSDKVMWYYHGENDKRKHHGQAWSIDKIRNAYGSQSFRKKGYDKLEATA